MAVIKIAQTQFVWYVQCDTCGTISPVAQTMQLARAAATTAGFLTFIAPPGTPNAGTQIDVGPECQAAQAASTDGYIAS